MPGIPLQYRCLHDGGKVVAMGPDEQKLQPTQSNPGTPPPDHPGAPDLAALTVRVEALERELAELRKDSVANPASSPAEPVRQTPPASLPSTLHIAKPVTSFEDRIGSQLFSRIGIVALLIATALFLKWAIDNQWLGPLARILFGLLAGAAIILWSERFRRRNFPAFAYALKAIGSGALYLSLWAAYQLYHLLPAPLALCALLLVTLWNAFMAWSQSSELLAAYALAGALATPLLLYSTGNYEIFLFTYLLLLDLATVVLVRLKSWPRLLFGAFPATVAYFIAWYAFWYNWPSTGHPAALTAFFLALFFLIFVTPSLRIPLHADPKHARIPALFLPLANATFIALALYSVLQDAGYHALLPWTALLLSAIYLALLRLPQTRITSAIHLALAVVFLTIAIPLKLHDQWITIAWLTEGAALLWLAIRLTPASADQPQDRVPHIRTLAHGFFALPSDQPQNRVPHVPSLGHGFPPSPPDSSSSAILRRLAALALALGFLGLLLQPLWLYPHLQTPFLNARFATALYGIAIFALATALALHAGHDVDNPTPDWRRIAAASTIAFNLTAILACVRELQTLFLNPTRDPDIDLQLALAISAFLMLYGAGLLAIGFWKRSAFLRWQALLLLVFTIAKVFLYDLRNLTQGYRVLSFLGLGALLMAISFAYQKDWLALREAKSEPQPAPKPDPKPTPSNDPHRTASPQAAPAAQSKPEEASRR